MSIRRSKTSQVAAGEHLGTVQGMTEFVAIVDAGSLSAAARALKLPRPTLSRRLARLEQRLGVRLLHRSTRRMRVTPAGAELCRRARPIVAATKEAIAAVQRLDDVPRGLLRVAAPPGSGGGVVGAMVLAYLAKYPEVQVALESSARHVDLVAEGFDVAIRAGAVRDTSLIGRQILRTRVVAVASPAYLDAFGRPEHPDELRDHRCVLGYEHGERPTAEWPLYAGGTTTVTGPLSTNDMELALQAALVGAAIGLIPEVFLDEPLKRGSLEVVLPGVVGAWTPVTIVYPDREFLPPKVRAFVDFAVQHLRHGEGLQAVTADAGRSPSVDADATRLTARSCHRHHG